MSRRQLLGRVTPLVAGVCSGFLSVPVELTTNKLIEDATGHDTGNAGIRQAQADACRDKLDPARCQTQIPFANKQIREILTAPVHEELAFRVAPSLITDELEKANGGEDPFDVIIHGTERTRFTRTEIVAGAISSLLFGAAHNYTGKKFNTRTIPASQTLTGAMFWVLQRRFGIVANLSAHLTGNAFKVAVVQQASKRRG